MLRASLSFSLFLAASGLLGLDIEVEVRNLEDVGLPEARVVLIALKEDPWRCEVVEQAITDDQGLARFDLERAGLFQVAAELAGFLGSEIGPFRVRGGRRVGDGGS